MTDRQLLRAVKTAAERRHRNRATDDQRLLEAMQAAEGVGATRTQLAESSGLSASTVMKWLGVRRPHRKRSAP